MNQAPDIDILVQRGGLVAADWRTRLPQGATPYTTAAAFLVRKGNPKSKVADRRGSRKVATAYLEFLFLRGAQAIIAKHNFRPRDEAEFAKHTDRFPAIATFSVESALGGWASVQAKHFADGALYDQTSARP